MRIVAEWDSAGGAKLHRARFLELGASMTVIRLLVVLACAMVLTTAARAADLKGTWVWNYANGNVTLDITGADANGHPTGTMRFQSYRYQMARQRSGSEVKALVNGNALTMETPGGAVYTLAIGDGKLAGRVVNRRGNVERVLFTRSR
jgi:hypothetical protein